jgi:S-layer family protein
MSWAKRIGGLVLVVVLGATGLTPASGVSHRDFTHGDIVVEVFNRDVAPGWIVQVGSVICPPETEELLWGEDYSDGFKYKERLTPDVFDFSPWQTGEPIIYAMGIDEGRATGELLWYLTCADGFGNPFGEARVTMNVLEQFSDVAPGAFFDNAVMWARLSGITTGTSRTTFSPNDPVSRWQMALFLRRFTELFEDTASDVDGFSDTGDLRDDFRRAIGWLAGTGVTTGVGNNRYDPDGAVSRWQMALFLSRLAEHLGADPVMKLDGFSDTAGLRDEFRGAIGWLADTGITTGVGGDRFDPDGTVSRGQMVTFLRRFSDWLDTV